MRTYLLSNNGDVFKIVGEFETTLGLQYNVKKLDWCSKKGRYLDNDSEQDVIHENYVHLIDTNESVIARSKSVMMGFS